MNFKIVARDNIDIEKWDALIENSSSPRIYATSDYLDSSTRYKWKALVFDDYKAVLPFFEKNSILSKYLAQPVLSQQLGLFISNDFFLERNLFLNEAINFLYENFKVANLSLNEGNWITFPKNVEVIPRTNFILDLRRNYEKIYSNYSRSLCRNIKKTSSLQLTKCYVSADEVLDFYQRNLNKKLTLKSKNLWAIKSLINVLVEKRRAAIYQVSDKNNEILTQSVFTFFGKRITHILGSSNQKGIDTYSMAFLMDKVIQENSNSDYSFDFEGSDVPGVKEFFRRFGPEEKKYPQLSWDKTAGIYSFVRKIKNQVNQ